VTYPKLTRDEHFFSPGPKRILSLDGGGLRGVLALGFLSRIESLLRKRYGGDPDFRLSHYFDLIAGTSTGAIIAASLAKGLTVREILNLYLTLGRDVFHSTWIRNGLVLPRYDDTKLREHLEGVFGSDTTLGSDRLKTGLLIVTKRVDTGSVWPLNNNPRGAYFRAPKDATWISNADYRLWQVVRASTAAPSYFEPELITITAGQGHKSVVGHFVDGGVSPFNNPSLLAVMYATLKGYSVGWPLGEDNLFVTSVGTGLAGGGISTSGLALQGAIRALFGLMTDCAALVETLMQWMSASPMARAIDSEVGDLREDLPGVAPALTYLRYNVLLDREAVHALMPELPDATIKTLGQMDLQSNIQVWKELGERAAEVQIRDEHFAPKFDLA